MKKLFFSIIALLLLSSLNAQTFNKENARKAAEELAKEYNLDANQTDNMVKIQERKLRNLSEIESLKSSNEKMYRHKKKAIYQSTDASIRRMLKADQMDVYKQKQHEKRLKRADLTEKMKAEGKTLQEIEDALLELEQ